MRIDTIVEGVVIDHIPAGGGMELYRYLGLDKLRCQVALIKNASSTKMKRKDIIKISGNIDINLDILGYIDPGITINIIKDSKIILKHHPPLPDRIIDVVRCRNPRCITASEQDISHIFKLTDAKKGIYRCVYCDTRAERDRTR
jgi:aspartate carbamoyltransferase regulatory subunit